MPRTIKALLLATTAALLLAAPGQGAEDQTPPGWSLSPSEITVNGVRLGETARLSITLTNNRDSGVSFSLAATAPPPESLRPGYEAIPDPGWVTLSPPQVRLDAGQQREVTAMLAVPAEGDWGGRSFECWLVAASQDLGIIQLELNSRLLVSTSPAYTTDTTRLVVGILIGTTVLAAGAAYGSRREIRRWLRRVRG
jgi:hypothetical protein